MKRIVDFKYVDMTNEEYQYYKNLINEFTYDTVDGKDQFRDTFDVDGDGCITLIRPPLKKQMSWAVLFFLQNLMINQRLRRMEKRIEVINERTKNVGQ